MAGKACDSGVLAELTALQDRVVKADARADEQLRPTTSETRRSGNRKRRVDCVEKRLPSDIPPRMMKAEHGLDVMT